MMTNRLAPDYANIAFALCRLVKPPPRNWLMSEARAFCVNETPAPASAIVLQLGIMAANRPRQVSKITNQLVYGAGAVLRKPAYDKSVRSVLFLP